MRPLSTSSGTCSPLFLGGPNREATLAAEMPRAGVWSCPTLITETLLVGVGAHRWPEMQYVPDSFVRRLARQQPGGNDASLPLKLQMIPALQATGAGVLSGTDAADIPLSPEMVYLVPGFALHRELALMVDRGGLTPYLGASWCGYCHKFDTFLHSPEVGKLMTDNYEFVHLITQESADKKALENPGADSVMKEMGMVGAGVPTFFILDDDGKKLATSMVMPPDGSNMGHPATPEEVKTFGDILEKTAPHMTAADRTKITDYLTAMAKQQEERRAALPPRPVSRAKTHVHYFWRRLVL